MMTTSDPTSESTRQPTGEPNGDFVSALVGHAEDQTLVTLRDRLADQAHETGVLDVAYRTIDTPVGELLIAATERGLVRVAYAVEGHETVLSTIAAQVSPRVLRAPARLDDAARELEEYFTGRRRAFDLPLDMRLARGFRRVVLEHLREIAYGATASYGVVATAAGKPAAVRAVGTACAKNPLPVVVPCHRVVRSDGAVGQYVGGPAAKQALITLEAA